MLALAASNSCQAGEGVRTNLAQSVPANVIFCARLDLNIARKEEQAQRILDAVEQRFKEQLAVIGQFSSLDLHDVDRIWVGVVKDKEALIILEGRFDSERILNSPVVTNSKRMVRPGTVVAIEMDDEKSGELSHGVVLDDDVIAFGHPQLVDRFVSNYVNGKSGWNGNGLAVMARLSASNALLRVALMQIPEKEIKQKPFLAAVVNAQMEVNMPGNVSATARVAMQDEGKAIALRDLISGFVGLDLANEIKMDYPDITKAVLDGLKLGTEGTTVTLSSAMDAELLRRLLRAKGLELN